MRINEFLKIQILFVLGFLSLLEDDTVTSVVLVWLEQILPVSAKVKLRFNHLASQNYKSIKRAL